MTLNKLKEFYLSTFLSIVILIVDLFFRLSSHLSMDKFVDKTVDYSSISFGFLLTVLTILLQTQTKAIVNIKNAGRFNDLIKANKRGVALSLILVFVSILFLSLYDSDLLKLIVCKNWTIQSLINSTFLAIFVFQLIEVVLFLEIFYITIRE